MEVSEWSVRIEGDSAKDIRLILGLNQSELAELLGVSQATISSWENNGVSGPASFALHALENHHRTKQEHALGEVRHAPRVRLEFPEPKSTLSEDAGLWESVAHVIQALSTKVRVQKDSERSMGEILDVDLTWDEGFVPVDESKRGHGNGLVFVPVGGSAILSVATDSKTNRLLWERLSTSRRFAMFASNKGVRLVFAASIASPPKDPFEPVSRWHLRLEQTFYQTSTEQNG